MKNIFQFKKPTPTHSVPVSDRSEAVLRAPIGDWSAHDMTPASSEGALALDVFVTDRQVVIRSVIAGVQPEGISIALHNDLLTIRGERQEEHTVEARQYMVRECYWGAFSRSVVLPVPVRPESANATMQHGVLTITVERSAPTTVSVQVR